MELRADISKKLKYPYEFLELNKTYGCSSVNLRTCTLFCFFEFINDHVKKNVL